MYSKHVPGLLFCHVLNARLAAERHSNDPLVQSLRSPVGSDVTRPQHCGKCSHKLKKNKSDVEAKQFYG